MKIGQFASAVLVFVVGSLLLTFLLSPSSLTPLVSKFRSFGDKISQSLTGNSVQKSEPANLKRVEIHHLFICASDTIYSEGGFHKNFCSATCDNQNLKYYSYDCIDDHHIVCNCLR